MADEHLAMQIITMRPLQALNPNHKFKFHFLDIPQSRWIMDVKCARGDDSLYLSPQITGMHEIRGTDATGAEYSGEASNSAGLHLSFHHSGTVNLSLGKTRRLLRKPQPWPLPGHLVTVGIKNTAVFQPASPEDVNTLSSKVTLLPVTGLAQLGPIFISVFRLPRDQPAPLAPLADTMQLNAECYIRNKTVKYLFVIWQHKRGPRLDADIAMLSELPFNPLAT